MSVPIVKVAWVPVNEEGKVLCVRTRGLELFYNVGGKPEVGESDIDALIREVREEVGVELVRSTILFLHELRGAGVDKAAGKDVVLRMFAAEYEGSLAPANEIAEMRWLGMAERQFLPPLGSAALEWMTEQGLLAA